MYAQKVVVHFADGSEKDVTLTQWSMGQFGQWAARQGLKVDLSEPGLMGVVMLRFQAFAELHRDPNMPRVSFDKWDLTVLEVEPSEESAEVDPTQPGQSGG
jgi:hypothetical protein